MQAKFRGGEEVAREEADKAAAQVAAHAAQAAQALARGAEAEERAKVRTWSAALCCMELWGEAGAFRVLFPLASLHCMACHCSREAGWLACGAVGPRCRLDLDVFASGAARLRLLAAYMADRRQAAHGH